MTLRVLHCIYDDPHNPWVAGGGAVRVGDLYRKLNDRVEATVVTGNYPGARAGKMSGVHYERLGAPAPYARSRLSYGRAATRLLHRGSYDAAIFDFSAYTPLLVPRFRPVGITVHHLTGPTARARWGPVVGSAVSRVEKSMLRRARYFSATSAATAAELRPLIPVSASVSMVYAGVPDDLFEVVREEKDYLLYFGRLDIFHKGIDVLLRAFALLVRDSPGIRLVVAGRGKDADGVRSLIRELHLQEHVDLRCGVSAAERRELLAGARVQMMPSRFEGFGMAAAEAMAAGVPLVASDAGSLPEVVAPPEGGLTVPPDRPDRLAAAVRALLDDPERRATLSCSARRSAGRFRWASVAEAHLGFLHLVAQAA
jgi:glycosyltransferase involved in cell wall biosynthesis